MSKIDRYHLLEAVGSQVLPVLLALPDVEVAAGTRPTFTDAQIGEAVEQTLGETGVGQAAPRRSRWPPVSRSCVRRSRSSRCARTPTRLIVPDSLDGL